jgi:ribosomal protein S18 acetylase RimI-like enzyme
MDNRHNLNLRIELAMENEFNVIQHIAFHTWPVAYKDILSKPQLEYMLGLFYSIEALNGQYAEGHIFLVVWNDNDPVGFASIEHRYKGTLTTRIHKIYVMPTYQGSGAGRFLISHIEQLAHNHKSEKLSLNVNKHNSSIRFYEHLGFEIVAEEVIHLTDEYVMDDYIMEKRLGAY